MPIRDEEERPSGGDVPGDELRDDVTERDQGAQAPAPAPGAPSEGVPPGDGGEGGERAEAAAAQRDREGTPAAEETGLGTDKPAGSAPPPEGHEGPRDTG
jgi:hypothetical protein